MTLDEIRKIADEVGLPANSRIRPCVNSKGPEPDYILEVAELRVRLSRWFDEAMTRQVLTVVATEVAARPLAFKEPLSGPSGVDATRKDGENP
jgi:hypothetical protein